MFEKKRKKNSFPQYEYIYIYIHEYRKYKEVKKERGWSVVKSKADTLAELRILAADRQKWRKLVNFICGEEFDEESACFD